LAIERTNRIDGCAIALAAADCDGGDGCNSISSIESSENLPIYDGGGAQRDRPVDDLGRGLDAPPAFELREMLNIGPCRARMTKSE
jgi:hypothetical protein